MLVGTPHPTNERIDKWKQLTWSLRCTVKLTDIQYSQAELDRARVVRISQNFQERLVDKNVISVCETRQTKVQRTRFSSTRHLVSAHDCYRYRVITQPLQIVDREFAEIGIPNETLVELDTDHSGLLTCHRNEKMLQAIKNLIKSALRWASTRHSTSSLQPSSSNDGSNESINDVLSDDSWHIADQDIREEQSENDDYVNLVKRSRTEITVLSALSSAHKSLEVPYSMLKPSERNPQFFGRQDLLSLMDDALLPTDKSDKAVGQGSCRSFAICGLGGVGKTELAREFAFSRQDRFDAVFWIDAEQATQLSEGFAAIASQLGYTDADTDRVVSRNVAREWLRNPVKRFNSEYGQRRPGDSEGSIEDDDEEVSWLLIFNNADNLELLKEYWPPTEKGSIILTSRDPMARHGRAGIILEPLKQEDAATLLRRLTGAVESPQGLQESLDIAARLGGLPLAVTQIAAYIVRWDMTLEEFLEFFDRQTSIEKVAKHKAPQLLPREHYKHSLFTVWTLERLSPQGLAILQLISFLNPDSIRESLINPDPSSPLTEPGAPAKPGGLPTTDDEYLAARLDLIRVSLARRNKAEKRLTMHRLVQDVVRSQMPSARAAQVLEWATLLVLTAWPTGFLRFDHDTATWEASEELLPHILKLKAFFQAYSEHMKSAEAKQNLARMLLFAAW